MSTAAGGQLNLSGANIFQGNVEIVSGMLDFQTADSLPSAVTDILIDNAGALEADPNNTEYGSVTAWLGSGLIDANSTGALALAGNSNEDIAMTGFPYLGLGAAATSVTYSGTLTPCDTTDTDIFGGGPGTLTVSTPPTGTIGVTIDGTVALGTTMDTTGILTVNPNTALDLGSYSATVGGLAGSGTIETSGGNATLTVDADTGTNTFAGTLQDGTDGQLAVDITGGTTVVLAGTCSQSGTTTVDRYSTLDAGSTTALSPNSVLVDNGLVDLNAFSNTAGSLSGDGAVQSSTGPATFTVTADGTAFSGTIQDGSGGGPLSLLVTGSGTAVLGVQQHVDRRSCRRYRRDGAVGKRHRLGPRRSDGQRPARSAKL